MSFERVFTAWAIGSVPSLPCDDPRLIETILAWMSLAAHSMPAMICDSVPDPWSLRTLPTASVASGATPFSLPSDAAPLPPTVEETCVPWPFRSATSWPSMKLLVSVTRSLRSGWVRSTPVSRTATLTPLPVSPASQAAGVPIWALLVSIAASTRASSQIFSTPPASRTRPEVALRAREVTSGATVRQNSPDVDASRAAPPTLGRPRTWRAPCGVALRAFFVYVTMSGSPPEDGSPSPCSIRAVTSKSSASRTPAWR